MTDREVKLRFMDIFLSWMLGLSWREKAIELREEIKNKLSER